MCGMKRTTYDDFGLSTGSSSFDDHCGKEHDPWTYVAYMAHLNRRHRQDCTGAEVFAKRAIANHSVWAPAKTSFVLEAQGKTNGGSMSQLQGTNNSGGGGATTSAPQSGEGMLSGGSKGGGSGNGFTKQESQVASASASSGT